MPLLLFAFFLFVPFAAADEPAAKQVELKHGDRIVFCGDSLTDMRGREVSRNTSRRGTFASSARRLPCDSL